MIDPAVIPDFDEPVAAHARKDLPLLRVEMTVREALDQIRHEGVGERVIYFYAVDEERRLAGVLPTRRLLTAPLEMRLEELMIRRVVALPATATVLEACEFFVLYKFLAFPVVDTERRVLGVVDVSLFARKCWKPASEKGNARQSPSLPMISSKRSGFGFPKSAVRHRCASFATVSPGCWPPCSAERSAPSWPELSKRLSRVAS